MKNLLAIAAAGEAVTGLILLVSPSIVVQLLFGAEIAGAGTVMSRIAGISLIALGMACWPRSERGRPDKESTRAASSAMLSYSLLATLYLGYVGAVREWVGILLWPAVGVHAVVTVLLARAWFKE